MSAVNRRRFLTGSLTVLGAGGAGAGVGLAGSGTAHATGGPSRPAGAEDEVVARELAVRLPFDGPHQSGILTPRQSEASLTPWTASRPTPTSCSKGCRRSPPRPGSSPRARRSA